jgi:hypothetical protein
VRPRVGVDANREERVVDVADGQDPRLDVEVVRGAAVRIAAAVAAAAAGQIAQKSTVPESITLWCPWVVITRKGTMTATAPIRSGETDRNRSSRAMEAVIGWKVSPVDGESRLTKSQFPV